MDSFVSVPTTEASTSTEECEIELENERLKHFLTVRNSSLRKQFMTLTFFQKEIIKVCENYKQTFTDALKMINQLLEPKLNIEMDLVKEFSDSFSNNQEHQIDKQLDNLTQELKGVNASIVLTQKQLKVTSENGANTNTTNDYLNKKHNELRALKENLNMQTSSEILKIINEEREKFLEIEYLVQVCNLLKQEIHKYDNSINVEVKQNEDDGNLEAYIDNFKECVKVFFNHVAKHLSINEFTKDCSTFVNVFKNVSLPEKSLTDDEFTEKLKNEYSSYKNILIDDQLQIIDDEIVIKKIELQFFKVLADQDSFTNQFKTLKSKKRNFLSKNDDRKNEELSEIKILRNENVILKQNENELQNLVENLELQITNLSKEVVDCHKKLQVSEQNQLELQEELVKMLDKEDEIVAFKMQQEFQESYVNELRGTENMLRREIVSLKGQISNLRRQNQSLQDANSNFNFDSNSEANR